MRSPRGGDRDFVEGVKGEAPAPWCRCGTLATVPKRPEVRSALRSANRRRGLALGVAAVAALVERPRSSAELVALLVTSPRALAAALRHAVIAPLVERGAGGELRAAVGATSATLPHRQRLALAGVRAPRALHRRAASADRIRSTVDRARREPGEFVALVRATERLWRRAHLTYDQAVEVGKQVRQRLDLSRSVVRRGAPPRLTPADAARLIAAAYRTASARGGDSRSRGLLVTAAK